MFVRHFYSPLSYLLLYANVWRGVYALRVETHISKLPNNVFVEEKFHNSLQTQNCIPKKKQARCHRLRSPSRSQLHF